MKLEQYARRLAEKTGTPELEPIILGDLPLTALPDRCMPWTGLKTTKERRVRKKMIRDGDNRPYQGGVIDSPYGIIQVEGRQILVHRYIFMLLVKPGYEFTLHNECGNTLCCNPMHWTPKGQAVPTERPDPDGFYYDPDEPWKQTEVNSLLDQAIALYEFHNWEELINTNLLIDCPRDMILVGLKDFRRPELYPRR